MILHQTRVEQTIDRDERGEFVKELVLTRIPSQGRSVPLAMVRKRSATRDGTHATVLLVHGYGQNRYAWHLPARSFTSYLARDGFDVYNLDLRGHGKSRHFGARLPSHVTDFVREDLPGAVEEIQRLSGDRPVFLIGHSLGGLLSYAAAPGLAGAVGGVVTLGSPYAFTRGSWTLALFGTLLMAVDRRMPLGEGALPLKMWGEVVRMSRVFIESPFFLSPIRGFAPGSMEANVLSQHMALAMDAGSITVMRNMFLKAHESRERGRAIGCLTGYDDAFEALDLPLLVIAGTRDDLAPPASVQPAYDRSRSTDKTYRAFPRGHIDIIVGRDAPQTIWPLIQMWLVRRSVGRMKQQLPPLRNAS